MPEKPVVPATKPSIDKNRILREQTEEEKKDTPAITEEKRVVSENIKLTHPLTMDTPEKKK